MSRKRISMRKIKEVLRLKYESCLSYEEIGRSCNIGHTTVGEYISRAKKTGLKWPLPDKWYQEFNSGPLSGFSSGPLSGFIFGPPI